MTFQTGMSDVVTGGIVMTVSVMMKVKNELVMIADVLETVVVSVVVVVHPTSTDVVQSGIETDVLALSVRGGSTSVQGGMHLTVRDGCGSVQIMGSIYTTPLPPEDEVKLLPNSLASGSASSRNAGTSLV